MRLTRKYVKLTRVSPLKWYEKTVILFTKLIQKILGLKRTIIDEAIEMKLLPIYMKTFRKTSLATFDLECVEKPDEEQIGSKTIKLGVQSIVSIAFASNIQDDRPKVFIRQSSEPKMGYKMVEEFLLHVFKVHEKYIESIPDEIKSAADKLAQINDFGKFGKQKLKLLRVKRFFKKIYELPIYGFNSSKVTNP